MKEVSIDEVMKIANAIYAAKKLSAAGVSAEDASYMAPETFPKIESDQVKALASALVVEFNAAMKANLGR